METGEASDGRIYPEAPRRMTAKASGVMYRSFLLFVAGLGGLLYGIDVGIIAAALLYLGKGISLSLEQTSFIVAAVMGGSMFSSLAAGVLADWIGRKRMMVISGLMFVISVVLIVVSNGFVPLFIGRLFQGMSGGIIAVVVPLYLADCLPAGFRGRGAGIFQFMLTFGIVIAAGIGWFYTQRAEAAIAVAAGNPALITTAQNHAWRGMFLSVIYPGLVFFAGSFMLSESPRWLFRKGSIESAVRALRRAMSKEEADRQLSEMEELAAEARVNSKPDSYRSLLRRQYVVPFLLACAILVCNQTTGINSILSFLVVILKQAGLSATRATQGDVVVKVLNCAMTAAAVALVDRKGRRFLLRLGTLGIIAALAVAAVTLFSVESGRRDVRSVVAKAQAGNQLSLSLRHNPLLPGNAESPMALTMLYSYGEGDRLVTIATNDNDPVLRLFPPASNPQASLIVRRALYGPLPTQTTGWLVAGCLAVFIASFAVGPGVVVWLTLSELMPTRIRSAGMGIALLLNQGVSTLIAATFLPLVGRYGYFSVFLFWACCTVIYFCVTTFWLPETKGRTLEEIEMYFETPTCHSTPGRMHDRGSQIELGSSHNHG